MDTLREYIQNNRNSGIDDSEIRRALHEAGWGDSEIEAAFNQDHLPRLSKRTLVVLILLVVLIPSAYLFTAKASSLWPFTKSSPADQTGIYTSSPEPSLTAIVTPTASDSLTSQPSFSATPQSSKTPSNTIRPTLAPKPQPSATSFATPQPTPNNILSNNLCSFDISLMPQAQSNAQRLLNLCARDVPLIEGKFGSGPRPYRIQFYIPGTGSAGTGTNSDSDAYVTDKVYLSTSFWQNPNTNDEEILAHELTHALQNPNAGFQVNWVTEALADYGAYVAGYQSDLNNRCYHFSTDMQNQTHVYDCTYKLIKFSEKYDSQLAVHLHNSLKSNSYSVDTWLQYTGKTFDQLTSECSQDSQCAGSYHGGL